jgi:hypothetical protein
MTVAKMQLEKRFCDLYWKQIDGYRAIWDGSLSGMVFE